MNAKQCPDCSGELGEIMIVDKSRYTEFISADTPLSYAAADAKRGWSGAIKAEGLIDGFVCKECGRILLYARPAE